MIKFAIGLSFLFLAASLMGQNSMARIDLQAASEPKVGMVFHDASEGIAVAQAPWLGEDKKDNRLIATVPVDSKWRKHSFAFIPKGTGKIQIILMGEQGIRAWIYYDSIEITGGQLQNGSFEILNPKGLPDAWSAMGNALAVESKDQAQSGKVCVRCNDGQRLIQAISVEEGKSVTVTFWAKAANPPETPNAGLGKI